MSGRYPSDTELDQIKNWPIEDSGGLLEFVASIWNWPDYAMLKDGIWHLSTGGWSGNEDIIHSMQSNHMFWTLCWQSSARGGHFTFKALKPKEPKS